VARRNPSIVLALGLAALVAGCASPSGSAVPLSGEVSVQDAAAPKQETPPPEADTRHGFFHTVLLYIPNRIFDVLDIVRLRARIGPGIGFTVRATELVDLKLGTWSSIYIGLRGPRLEPEIPWPFGFDNYAGAGVSFAEAETGEQHYGRGEIGLGVHVLIVGFDVGVDLWEIGDLVLGLFTIDISHDDF
jgi:hypothetical protein